MLAGRSVRPCRQLDSRFPTGGLLNIEADKIQLDPRPVRERERQCFYVSVCKVNAPAAASTPVCV